MGKTNKAGFLQRWLFIIDKITTYPYITLAELMKALEEELPNYDSTTGIGFTTRTIERDLAEIRKTSSLDIDIRYCKRNKGYYIPQDEKSISKLGRLFDVSSLFSFSMLKDIVFEENRISKGLEHRLPLVNAIRKSVEIVIDYTKYDASSTKKVRTLRPYALREYKYRWYLLAIEKDSFSGKEMMKVWGLDRIEKLTLTNQTFTKDTTINLSDLFKHCFGVYCNKDIKPEKVVLSFTPLCGNYIKSCPLHESQKVLIDNDKETRVELTIQIAHDFISELLSHTGNMRVIEPVHLRNKLVEIYAKAMEMQRE